MLRVPCYVSLNDYLEKLRARPARERERIAVIATGVSFVIILVIWLVSFSEMNKEASKGADNTPLQDQLEELKENTSESRQSIEEMMQSLPQDPTGLENLDSSGTNTGNQGMGAENQSQNLNAGDQNNQPVPTLPKNNQENNQGEIPSLP